MAGFRYEAIGANGKVQRGVVESDNPRQARAWLREQGLTPTELEPIGQGGKPAPGAKTQGPRTQSGREEKPAPRRVRGWRRGLSTTQLAIMTRQLSTLLGAGLTVEQTLNALIEQSETEHERQLIAGIRSDVLAGLSLARSLGNQVGVFPEVYLTLVDAGERWASFPTCCCAWPTTPRIAKCCAAKSCSRSSTRS